jgi:hypothetical protein
MLWTWWLQISEEVLAPDAYDWNVTFFCGHKLCEKYVFFILIISLSYNM